MIAKAIYYILSNNTTVKNLVSTRIYPINRPQAIDTPAILYDIFDSNGNPTKNGASQVDEYSVDISAWAATYELCESIIAAVRSALENLKGTYNSIKIQSSWVTKPQRDGNVDSTEIFSIFITLSFRVSN